MNVEGSVLGELPSASAHASLPTDIPTRPRRPPRQPPCSGGGGGSGMPGAAVGLGGGRKGGVGGERGERCYSELQRLQERLPSSACCQLPCHVVMTLMEGSSQSNEGQDTCLLSQSLRPATFKEDSASHTRGLPGLVLQTFIQIMLFCPPPSTCPDCLLPAAFSFMRASCLRSRRTRERRVLPACPC